VAANDDGGSMGGVALRRAGLALALAAALGGCSRNPAPEVEPGSPAADVLVSVSNQNPSDVDVFLVVSGVRLRLGTVTALGTGSFQVPWERVSAVTDAFLLVSPVGHLGAYRSPTLLLRPGSEVTVNVAPALGNSTTTIY